MRRALTGVTARGRGYRVAVAAPETSRSVSIPAPVGGWDAISPKQKMAPLNAITLENVFPQPGYVEIRKGHARVNIIANTPAIETLAVYHAPTTASDRMFAFGGTAAYDVTTPATASNSTTVLSGLANARWQFVNVNTSGGRFLWGCNGADTPRYYDGAAWNNAVITGITSTQCINVTNHKNRLWLVRTGTLDAAYLNTDSIQGTATPFVLSQLFKKGGQLQAIGTWTLDAGEGPDDYICFLTSNGEVAVYQGTDPATNFTIKGVYEMGSPLGRRCIQKVGSDLAVVCVDGVVPLSRALITDRAAALSIAITKNIQPEMNAAARLYGQNFGWQLIGYPRGTRAILNVPVNSNTEQQQYVMNTVTGAWCKFKRENANCWVVWRDVLYYGGNAGQIVKADCQGYDDDGNIDFTIQSAFNYCKSSGQKNFDLCRAILTTDGTVQPGLAVNVDFGDDATADIVATDSTDQALWDVALWDAGDWPVTEQIVADWQTIAGEGWCASIVMEGTLAAGATTDKTQSVTFQVNGWDLLVRDAVNKT